MKQILFLIFVPLLILAINSNLVSGQGIIEIKIPYSKFEHIKNGKPSETKTISAITVLDLAAKGKFYANWKSVSIEPLNTVRRIRLWSNNFSTEDGSISDVKADKDHFSFTIRIGDKSIWNIVGKKKKNAEGYDISGKGLLWDDILRESIISEMRPIDRIVLPYNEVFP